MAATITNHWDIHTTSHLEEISATWTIENARFRVNPFYFMKSPPFYSKDKSQKWYLCISSSVISSVEYAYVYMTVECEDVLKAEYAISIVASNDKKIRIKNSPCSESTSKRSLRRGEPCNIPVQRLFTNEEWLSDGKLTLFCAVKVIAMPSERPKVPFTLPDVYQNKLSMLDDPRHTDVVLVVGDRELKAHKVMLVAHSSVFDAMFKSGMKENSQNRVEIADLDYDVVEQMLQFIYTDNAPKLELMACRLLEAADKYDLGRLKIVCERALADKVSANNAMSMLALANRHNAEQLTAHANSIIAKNIEEVMQSGDWRDLVDLMSSVGDD